MKNNTQRRRVPGSKRLAVGVAKAVAPSVRPENCHLIYFFGRSDGAVVKVGISRDVDGARRRQAAHTGRAEDVGLDFNTEIAFVWGYHKDETAIINFFKKNGLILDGRNNTEHIIAGTSNQKAMQLVRPYLRYLRERHFVGRSLDEMAMVSYVPSSEWLPTPDRVSWLDVLPLHNHGPWGDVMCAFVTEKDYYTHPKIINAARSVMGSIDLDQASHPTANGVVMAKKIYTAYNSGLSHDWYGNVWLNPPFNQWSCWAPKVIAEVSSGRVSNICVFATANAATNKAVGPMIQMADAICITTGRYGCWGELSSSAGEGSVIMYFGDKGLLFCEEFKEIGSVFVSPAAGRLLPNESNGVEVCQHWSPQGQASLV